MSNDINYKSKNSKLGKKLKTLFPDSTVDKALVRSKQIARLPRYISEYILMKMVGDNPTPDKFAKMENFISKYHPEKKDKELVKSRVMELGATDILDRIKVEADPSKDRYWCEVPSIDATKVPIDRNLVIENETLLQKGTWGFITLEKRGLGKEALTVSSFEPFQITSYEIEYFFEKRESFTTEEWIDCLINTIGFNPEIMSLDEKLMHLIRLVPICENNVNYIELGPKGTGKTYLYRNISNYSRVISGGRVTPAVLFYNLSLRRPGLLGLFDVVVFDEVSSAKLKDSEDTINKLKDFMESGVVSRGRQEMATGASLVFVGNIQINENGLPTSTVQFEILPKEMIDTAFLDRFTGYIPGWKFTRIKDSKNHLSNDYGFALDYFSEILHDLRKFDLSDQLIHRMKLINFDIRDEKAFRKNLSGLLKILFPNRILDEKYLPRIIELAISLRQRVIDQISLLDTEFVKKQLKIIFTCKDENNDFIEYNNDIIKINRSK